jgi:WD40 repeat protein
MSKVASSVLGWLLLGLPLWVVLGVLQSQPSALVITVEEPDARVWVGDREYPVRSGEAGPIELEPGEHLIRVTRGDRTLFSRRVSLEPGKRVEVWARSDASAAVPHEPRSEVARLGAGRPLMAHEARPTVVAFSGDGRRLFSADEGGSVKVWDLAVDRQVQELRVSTGPVQWLQAPGDGRRIVVAAEDGGLRLWDVDSDREVRALPTGTGSKLRCAAASPDGRRVRAGSRPSRSGTWPAGGCCGG